VKQEFIDQALFRIAQCSNPKELHTMIKHGLSNGLPQITQAARLRLYAILPADEPGTLEFDVWQSIHALEDALSNERGKTIRLSRTRQMIQRVGELQTIVKLVNKKTPSEGFKMLVDRGMAELAFEAVALRHSNKFEGECLAKCRQRLESHIAVEPSHD
jgi:hypothetical protein